MVGAGATVPRFIPTTAIFSGIGAMAACPRGTVDVDMTGVSIAAGEPGRIEAAIQVDYQEGEPMGN